MAVPVTVTVKCGVLDSLTARLSMTWYTLPWTLATLLQLCGGVQTKDAGHAVTVTAAVTAVWAHCGGVQTKIVM